LFFIVFTSTRNVIALWTLIKLQKIILALGAMVTPGTCPRNVAQPTNNAILFVAVFAGETTVANRIGATVRVELHTFSEERFNKTLLANVVVTHVINDVH
jgi:hypothetical protein